MNGKESFDAVGFLEGGTYDGDESVADIVTEVSSASGNINYQHTMTDIFSLMEYLGFWQKYPVSLRTMIIQVEAITGCNAFHGTDEDFVIEIYDKLCEMELITEKDARRIARIWREHYSG